MENFDLQTNLQTKRKPEEMRSIKLYCEECCL